jgi:DNA-binding NtrC family response regulator
VLSPRGLPRELRYRRKQVAEAPAATDTLREIEAQAIMDALKKSGGNKSKAAKMLGISRKTLYKRLAL